MVKVLVVGATGFLGKLIALEAIAAGHEVTALVRSDSQAARKDVIAELKAAGVAIATGDLDSDQKDLVSILKGQEVVRSGLLAA